MTQQDFSACGVHPTCSVSTIRSFPGAPLVPSDAMQYTRRQYVAPGSKSTASPFTNPPSGTSVMLVADAQSCSNRLYSNWYLSATETDLNCTEMVVCKKEKNSIVRKMVIQFVLPNNTIEIRVVMSPISDTI